MNIIIAIYLLSIAVILTSMTYLAYRTLKSKQQLIDAFNNRTMSKVSVPEYTIQYFDDFLTPEQCDHIIEISKSRLKPSMVYSDTSDVYDTRSRISEQAWLQDKEDPVVAFISKKVSEYSGMPIQNQEDLQVVSYKPGGFFTPHYDSCEGDTGYCERMDGASGARYLTYIIYLNDDFEGGETAFPEIKKEVKPKKGKCVVFQSTILPPDGRTILQALHGGNPVKSGNKWICNKWVRANTFTSS